MQGKWRTGRWHSSELGPPEDLKRKQENPGKLRLFLPIMEGEIPAIGLRNKIPQREGESTHGKQNHVKPDNLPRRRRNR